MFGRLGSIVSRHWALVTLSWIVVAVGLSLTAPQWDQVTHDGDLAYLPEYMPSVAGEKLLADAFPSDQAKSQMVVIVQRPGEPLRPDDLRVADQLAAQFRQRGDLPVLDVWTRQTDVIGHKLQSRDQQAVLVVVRMTNEFMATDNIRVLNAVGAVLDDARGQGDFPVGLQLGVCGSAAVGGDMLSAAAESIQNTELTTVLAVLLILLVVYRALVLALIPLATISISVMVAMSLVALLTQLYRVPGFGWWDFKIFTTTKIFVIVILFGSGTDFCLFLISRYKEELQRGRDKAAAASHALGKVGAALAGSALTTIGGLATMYFCEFGKFRNSGPAIAMCLAVTLAACLTLTPALLRAFGPVVFWPFGIQAIPRGAAQRLREPRRTRNWFDSFWNWTAGAIVARPGLILVVSVALLSPLAYAGLSVPTTSSMFSELSPTRASMVGAAMMRRHFPCGDLGPVTVLAVRDGGGFNTPQGENEIAELTKVVYDLEGVDSVRSVAEPLGDKPGMFQPFSSAGRNKLAARKHPITTQTYLTQVPGLVGDVARLDVILDCDPFSKQAIRDLANIERALAELGRNQQGAGRDARFLFTGIAASTRDLQQVTSRDQTRIQVLVLITVMAILIAVLRRPMLCVYLILSVLFSYYVTIGAAEMFFTLQRGDAFDGLDWKVPIFLFVILIAVGEDYNIYLTTRVIEEQQRHGAIEGLRIAVARTGGIITSCGVIMAATFVSMMSGSLSSIVQLGFALSTGVMLDTFIVRPILVPAFMTLVASDRWRTLRRSPPGDPRGLAAVDGAVTVE